MKGLVIAQLARKGYKQWAYILVLLYVNALIAITQFSWEYYADIYSYWNILLSMTNNSVCVLYNFTLIFALVCMNSIDRDAWNQAACSRSYHRAEYFTSLIIVQGIQTALFVLLIPVSILLLGVIYPLGFQNSWMYITAAATMRYTPSTVALISLLLLFFRYFWFALMIQIINIPFTRFKPGVALFLIITFVIDAKYEMIHGAPECIHMLKNTLVSISTRGEWSQIDIGYSVLYWSVMCLGLALLGYWIIKHADLSCRGVR